MELAVEFETTLKDQAAEEIEAIITDCESVLEAARDIKLAIERRDAKAIRTGLKTLHDHTDGYWNRLVLGHGTGEMYALAEEIEECDAEAGVDSRCADRENPLASNQGA